MRSCTPRVFAAVVPGPMDIYSAPGGAPSILVLEDDWRTRRFICTALRCLTRSLVVDAASPHEALLLMQSLPSPIDLLISDIELGPAANGVDFARQMAASMPSLGVLLMSGRDDPPRGIPPAWRFLSKPFPTAALLGCVQDLCRSAHAN